MSDYGSVYVGCPFFIKDDAFITIRAATVEVENGKDGFIKIYGE